MKIPRTARAILVCLLTSFLFGMSFIFIRLSITEVSLLTMLSWRHLIAITAMTLCAKFGILNIHLKGKDIRPLLKLSLYQPILYYIFESAGVKHTTASESGIIIATIPIVTMICGMIFLKERPSRTQAFFMVMTVAGAILAAGIGGVSTAGSVIGYSCLFVAVLCDSGFSFTTQKITGFTSAERTYVMCASGAVVFTLGAVIENAMAGTLGTFITLPFSDTGFLICLLYLSIGCNIVAFLCMNYAISIIGATRRSAFAGLSTVVTLIASAIVLDEKILPLQFVAAALILGGVTGVNVIGILNEKKEAAQAS